VSGKQSGNRAVELCLACQARNDKITEGPSCVEEKLLNCLEMVDCKLDVDNELKDLMPTLLNVNRRYTLRL